MPDDRAYRLTLDFEDPRFVARVNELGVRYEADDEASAVAGARAAVESAVEEAAVRGETLPPPLSESAPQSLTLPLSGALTRDLVYLARAEDVSPESLALQLIAHGIGRMMGQAASETPTQRPEPAAPREERGPRRKGGRRGGPRGNPDIDNQADFLAYVRDMEHKGGRRR
ncbi:MAG: hypothetical protein AAGD10_00590 [Myxococcota bacterium]